MKEMASPPGYKSALASCSPRQSTAVSDPESTTPVPSAGSALAPVANLRRRMSIRATGVRPRRSTSSVAASGGAGGVLGPPSVSAGGAAHIQLLSIPQLDAIQRTLRILDVRLQHVQSNGPARSQPAGKQLHGTVEVSRPSVHTHTERERERAECRFLSQSWSRRSRLGRSIAI